MLHRTAHSCRIRSRPKLDCAICILDAERTPKSQRPSRYTPFQLRELARPQVLSQVSNPHDRALKFIGIIQPTFVYILATPNLRAASNSRMKSGIRPKFWDYTRYYVIRVGKHEAFRGSRLLPRNIGACKSYGRLHAMAYDGSLVNE